MLTDEYIEYIRTVRRYSSRTRDIYREVHLFFLSKGYGKGYG